MDSVSIGWNGIIIAAGICMGSAPSDQELDRAGPFRGPSAPSHNSLMKGTL